MGLGFPQGPVGDDVQLNMHTAQFEVCLEQAPQLALVCRVVDELGVHLHIQGGTVADLFVLDPGHGLENRCGAFPF